MEIVTLRKKVDEIDKQILHLLKERVKLCKSIGVLKRAHRISVRDQQREDEVYENILRRASELGLDLQGTKAVYQEIMAISVHAQESDTKT